MNRAQALELRDVLGSARELMSELIDEGVDEFDRSAAQPESRESPATGSAELDRGDSDTQLPLASIPADSGTSPTFSTSSGIIAPKESAQKSTPDLTSK